MRDLVQALVERKAVIIGMMEWALILFPLMLYLLVLGLKVNRGTRPTVVRGPRNLASLLLGLSGFLLLGPPSWLVYPFRTWGRLWYWSAYVYYVLMLFWFGFWLVRRQRRMLVVYQIDAAAFGGVLEDVLARLNEPYAATPGRISFSDGRLVLDIDTLPAMNNVSLCWHGESQPIEAQFEVGLRAQLSQTPASASSTWFALTMVGIFLFVFILIALLLYALLLYVLAR